MEEFCHPPCRPAAKTAAKEDDGRQQQPLVEGESKMVQGHCDGDNKVLGRQRNSELVRTK